MGQRQKRYSKTTLKRQLKRSAARRHWEAKSDVEKRIANATMEQLRQVQGMRRLFKLYGFSLCRVRTGYGTKHMVRDRYTALSLSPMGVRELAELVMVMERRLKQGKRLRLTDQNITIEG